MIRWLVLALLAGMALASAALAEDIADRTRAAAQEIAEATQVLEQSGGEARVRDLARAIRAYEGALAVLRDEMRLAAQREEELRATHQADALRLSRLMGTLYMLQIQPAPVVQLHPAGPVAAVATADLARLAGEGLAAEAREYGESLDELRALNALRDEASGSLRRGLAGLLNARAGLEDGMARGDPVPSLYVEDRVQVQILAATAADLTSFAQALSALPLPDYGSASPGDAAWSAPAEGRLIRRFGEADAAGVVRPGAIIETMPLALVQAPFAATIRFAGPFLDYGNVVLLEPSAGDILILAGIGRLMRAEGDVLAAGDPIGLMGGGDAGDEEFLIADSPETQVQVGPSLYIEFRDDDTPVDPAPLFHLE